MPHTRTNLSHFITEQQRKYGGSGSLTILLNDLVTAIKMIHNQVNHGALVGALGSAGEENVQGEVQKKLDVLSNEIMIQQCQYGGTVAAMASEEEEDVYHLPAQYPRGKYLLLFDPLDGSSNIDINVSVGTIFSILKAPEGVENPTAEHFMQPGTTQVCAGYALYGPSTMLVLTTGHGVDGFTYDDTIGTFLLTHPQMKIAEDTREFAINASRMRHWDAPIARYVDECMKGKEGPRGENFNMRWVASMVAEIHRILNRGGVFMYPIDAEIREKGGRLRLMYEGNPMAMIVEQAGGMAITGTERILEVAPTKLHQRVPVILGSKNEVQRIWDYHKEA